MKFISIFFVLASFFVLAYFVKVFRERKRMPIIFELFFSTVYAFVVVVFLYPRILNIIEEVFGIASALNFIVYLSIFVAYFLLFTIYRTKELQRIEISKMVREIAFLKDEMKEFLEENSKKQKKDVKKK